MIAKRGRSPLQPNRAATEYALLGLLAQAPSYGYDLTKQFAPHTELGQVCRLQMSMIYGLLKKLEQAGFVQGQTTAAPRDKRLLEITSAGQTEFEKWLTEPVLQVREIRLGFLIKLFFVGQTSQALPLLEKQIIHNQTLLKEIETQHKRASKQFERWVLDFRLEQSRAVLNWLVHCRSELIIKLREEEAEHYTHEFGGPEY